LKGGPVGLGYMLGKTSEKKKKLKRSEKGKNRASPLSQAREMIPLCEKEERRQKDQPGSQKSRGKGEEHVHIGSPLGGILGGGKKGKSEKVSES